MVGLRVPKIVEKTMLCKLYNKGTCRYEKQAEHTKVSPISIFV